MAYLEQPWPLEGFGHRYITREKLLELLAALPEHSLLVVNRVGHLSVMRGLTPRGDWYGEPLGYLDLGAEAFEGV